MNIKKVLASSAILLTLSSPITIKASETYTFKKGDTFNRVCFINYKDLKYNYRLAYYNGIIDINKLDNNLTISLPTIEELENFSFTYKVEKNDTLEIIAQKFFGDALLGSLIGEYNCLNEEIKPNDEIFIPSFNQLMELNNACIGKVKKYVRTRSV